MIELSTLETVCSLGVGALFGFVVFFVYRFDRRATENRLGDLLERDQETREANTKVMAEMLMFLKGMNGRVHRK